MFNRSSFNSHHHTLSMKNLIRTGARWVLILTSKSFWLGVAVGGITGATGLLQKIQHLL